MFGSYFNKQVSIAPLAVFRVVFGAVMLLGVIRFMWWGWIDDLYVRPEYYFTYQGFEWIKPMGKAGMYLLFGVMGFAAFCIMTGLLYRISCPLFFLSFTYVELIDKTTYLNHYYFVSIIAFLLCLLPAHRCFSLDVKLGITKPIDKVPAWMPDSIKLQIALVFIFAGLAKINYDWLINTQPLSIWLSQKGDVPIIGSILTHSYTSALFAWMGLLYDISIPFFLWNKKYRWYAFGGVFVFHMLTWLLFNIGMFPFIMIGATSIFLGDSFHKKCILKFHEWFRLQPVKPYTVPAFTRYGNVVKGILAVHFIIQLALPFRYLAYPGNLFWTEEGFRFSWRVMLIEKKGDVTFRVIDSKTQSECTIFPSQYLTSFQVRMMSTQPDMILQFAHFLRDAYNGKTIQIDGRAVTFNNPNVKVQSFVSLNGGKMRRFIDADTDLASIPVSWKHKTWITGYPY